MHGLLRTSHATEDACTSLTFGPHLMGRQLPRLQEALALRLVGGYVVKEGGEVGVLVQPRVLPVDQLRRRTDHAREGEAVEGRDRHPGLRRVNNDAMQHALVPPVAKYLRRQIQREPLVGGMKEATRPASMTRKF